MLHKIFIVAFCLFSVFACTGQEPEKTNKKLKETLKTIPTFQSHLNENPRQYSYEPDVWKDFDSKRAFYIKDLENVDSSKVHIIGNIGTPEEVEILFEKLPTFHNIEAIEIIGTNLTNTQFETLINLLIGKAHFKKLNINNAGLKSIPAKIGQLRHLTTLDIPRNSIQKLPKEIGQLKNLKTLRLYNCRSFHTFPAELGTLSKLINLDFAGTRVEYLPNLNGCISLKIITGNACRLKAFPKGIGNCQHLKSINFGANKISEIPAEVGQIKGLEDLGVGSNSIKTIPNELAVLTNLYIFDISNNQFTSFPEIFFNYKKSLTNLWLHGNEIKNLPIEIADFKGLDFILVDLKKINPADIEAIKTKNPKLRFIDEGSK